MSEVSASLSCFGAEEVSGPVCGEVTVKKVRSAAVCTLRKRQMLLLNTGHPNIGSPNPWLCVCVCSRV